MKCRVIEWNKNRWVDPSLDTDGQDADRDTIRVPLPDLVDRVFPEDSVRVYESAL